MVYKLFSLALEEAEKEDKPDNDYMDTDKTIETPEETTDGEGDTNVGETTDDTQNDGGSDDEPDEDSEEDAPMPVVGDMRVDDAYRSEVDANDRLMESRRIIVDNEANDDAVDDAANSANDLVAIAESLRLSIIKNPNLDSTAISVSFLSLESHKRRLRFKEVKPVLSLEEYSTDPAKYAKIVMESFRSAISALWDAIVRAIVASIQWIKKTFAKIYLSITDDRKFITESRDALLKIRNNKDYVEVLDTWADKTGTKNKKSYYDLSLAGKDLKELYMIDLFGAEATAKFKRAILTTPDMLVNKILDITGAGVIGAELRQYFKDGKLTHPLTVAESNAAIKAPAHYTSKLSKKEEDEDVKTFKGLLMTTDDSGYDIIRYIYNKGIFDRLTIYRNLPSNFATAYTDILNMLDPKLADPNAFKYEFKAVFGKAFAANIKKMIEEKEKGINTTTAFFDPESLTGITQHTMQNEFNGKAAKPNQEFAVSDPMLGDYVVVHEYHKGFANQNYWTPTESLENLKNWDMSVEKFVYDDPISDDKYPEYGFIRFIENDEVNSTTKVVLNIIDEINKYKSDIDDLYKFKSSLVELANYAKDVPVTDNANIPYFNLVVSAISNVVKVLDKSVTKKVLYAKDECTIWGMLLSEMYKKEAAIVREHKVRQHRLKEESGNSIYNV